MGGHGPDFGQLLTDGNYSSGSYRFGFNGMEKDDEVYGTGNSMTAMFWQYDSRIGRRWNLDPAYKHYISNYSTFGNNPIIFTDPFGDDWFVNHQGFYLWSDNPSVPGFSYAGTVLPEGVDRYKILTIVNGRYYHKNTQNAFASLGNEIDSWFGGDDDYWVEHKPYDPAEESFNEELLANAIGFGALKVGGLAYRALRAAGGSIWKLPVLGQGGRGFVYERMLGLKGMMKSPNFPVIDAFYKGVATSVKTLDIFAEKYVGNNTAIKKQLVKYVDDLANFHGRTWGDDVVRGADISKRVLEVGIPKGASETVVKQIKEAVKYATDKGIEMNVRIVN